MFGIVWCQTSKLVTSVATAPLEGEQSGDVGGDLNVDDSALLRFTRDGARLKALLGHGTHRLHGPNKVTKAVM